MAKALRNPSRKPLRPTLADVAKHAGVAVSTASAVLSRREHCYASEQTRQRVQEAVSELGYRPNRMARSLRGQTTKLIGVVFPDIARPAITTLRLSMVEDAALQDGLQVIFGTHRENPLREADYIREMLTYNVDGMLIYSGRSENAGMIQEIYQQGLPVVICEPICDYPGVPTVLADREEAGYLQVKHILGEAGRKRIAFIVGSTGGSLGQAKLRGHRRGLKEFGSCIEEHLFLERVVVSADSYQTGVEMGHEALASGEKFDAVVTSADSLALGVMSALVQAGIGVPEDVAIIGHDGEDFAAALPVPLSTVHQSRDLGVIAYRLMQKLIERNKSGDGDLETNILIEPELVVRASTMGSDA